MASSKGSVAVSKKFMLIAILITLVILIAVWLLLNSHFIDYVVTNINSDVRLCSTFEQAPLLGSVGCPD